MITLEKTSGAVADRPTAAGARQVVLGYLLLDTPTSTGSTQPADREPATNQDQDHVRQLLERLPPVVGPGCCPV
ncbi:hypothetical protein ACFXPY_12800 [Streptomyces sp. NPDC059153]|uniref:hypothetical protein n=1 Tax=Streptomyces sp. NPDC059153 TaxID=3346743 RepID=UPI00367E1A83